MRLTGGALLTGGLGGPQFLGVARACTKQFKSNRAFQIVKNQIKVPSY